MRRRARRPPAVSPAAVRPRADRAALRDLDRVAPEPRADSAARRADASPVQREEDAAHARGPAGVVAPRREEAALAADDRRLDLESQRPGWARERRPVPEHGVAVLDLDLVGPDRRGDAVHLEDPAARGPGRIAPDLVDVRAEGGLRDVVVELAGQAGRIGRIDAARR